MRLKRNYFPQILVIFILCVGGVVNVNAATYKIKLIPVIGVGDTQSVRVWLQNQNGGRSKPINIQSNAVGSITVDTKFGNVSHVVVWASKPQRYIVELSDGVNSIKKLDPEDVGPEFPVSFTAMPPTGVFSIGACCTSCTVAGCTGCREKIWIETFLGCSPGTISANCDFNNDEVTCFRD